MTQTSSLDVAFCRRQFPALDGTWAFLENAGGTLVPRQVIERTRRFMTHNQVQPGEGYGPSVEGAEHIEEGRAALAAVINAEVDEIVIGPSTSSNVYVLSHALTAILAPGDEVIVTNQDHEANNGAWRALERQGLVIKEWQASAETDDLEVEDLEALLSERTRLVCFTHCSNIAGLVHDVAAITARIHAAGALVCVDGVAYASHRRVDVKALDVDLYLYSPYKVFGPHMGVLYGKRDLLASLANQGHYFVPGDDAQRRLCPGGYNYELTAAAGGITEYFDLLHEHHHPGTNLPRKESIDRVYGLTSAHEDRLAGRLEDYLRGKPQVRLVGARAERERVGVYAFTIEGRDSREIPPLLHAERIGVHADDFYAARYIDALGVRPQGGVVRVSLAHYNDDSDLERVIEGLERAI